LQLSVIIPSFNEEKTLEEIIKKVNGTGLVKEIIVVDDGSEDNSMEILDKLKDDNQFPLKVLHHKQNKGKGSAVRTGLSAVEGDIVLIQDADLEYDPAENYHKVLEPFSSSDIKVVYGSRNLTRNQRSSVVYYWGVLMLSWMTNILYGSRITDAYTCYKVLKTDVIKDLKLESKGFEFCAEVTSKVLRKKIKIYEVPITYVPRSRKDGKKIKWFDGMVGIWTLLKYRF
jgi:glycosyltransferase involved in cell wall biosynthesis